MNYRCILVKCSYVKNPGVVAEINLAVLGERQGKDFMDEIDAQLWEADFVAELARTPKDKVIHLSACGVQQTNLNNETWSYVYGSAEEIIQRARAHTLLLVQGSNAPISSPAGT